MYIYINKNVTVRLCKNVTVRLCKILNLRKFCTDCFASTYIYIYIYIYA
jgi:hypothetical protein